MPKRKVSTGKSDEPQKRARTSDATEDAEMTAAVEEKEQKKENVEEGKEEQVEEKTPKRKGSAKGKAKAKAKAKGKGRASSRKKAEAEEEGEDAAEKEGEEEKKDSSDGQAEEEVETPKLRRSQSSGKLPAGVIDEEAGKISFWPTDLPLATEAKHSVKAGDKTLKIVCFNVAGLRAAAKKGLPEYLAEEKADIVMLSEVKCTQDQNPMKETGYPHIYWNACTTKAGYSGIAVLSREKPAAVKKGIGVLDEEGRVLTLDYGAFYLVAAYVPNSGEKLQNLKVCAKFDVEMVKHISKLNAEKPVIYCGDLNVAIHAYDVYDGETNRQRKKSAGFTDQERWAFSKVLGLGFVDAYRHKYPDAREEAMTYWSHRFNMKKQNKGWRLDYFVLSPSLVPLLEDVKVKRELNASDHAPLVMTIRKPEPAE